jgi:hypothetical protein
MSEPCPPDAPALLVGLRSRGAVLRLRETTDGLSASVSGPVTADDLAALKEHRTEVVSLLLAEARVEADRWYDDAAALRRAPLFWEEPKGVDGGK